MEGVAVSNVHSLIHKFAHPINSFFMK